MPIQLLWGDDSAALERAIQTVIDKNVDPCWASINVSRLDGSESGQARQALEEAITSWNGVTMCISHDRWFLNKICTHIMAYEGDSQVTFFQGSYDEYEEHRKERMGGGEPTRIKYRPMPAMA